MGNPLAVLIVEDSDSDAQFIVRLLKKAGYEVAFQVVETAAHMRAALEQSQWDVVISDYSLPQFDGPAALRLLQETGLDLPFIAVSGTMGEAAAVAMMKAGAHDYLMKGNLARLAPAVEREIAQAEVRRKRRQAEAALRESERLKSELFEKLNEAQQIALIGSWEWNLRTDRVWWSDETYRIFGVTPQDFVPGFEANGRFIHPDDAARYDQTFQHSLQTGEPLDVDLRLVVNDGRLKHCQAKGKIVYDEASQPLRFIGTVMDITGRKQAEAEIQKLNAELEQRVIERTAELARQRERERAILDAMGEGVVFTDRAGTIEYINPALERLTGFTAPECLGQNPRLWQSGQTPPAVYRQLWDTITRGGTWQGEMVNRRQDGRLYEAALIAAPLTNPDRQIVGFVGVQRDITRQKELDRLKDKFVSNVSHELRTPLTSILLNLDLVDHGKPEKRDLYLAALHREAERLRQMIEDLLDISRLDRETTPIELAAIDLHQLLASLVADRATLAVERGLTLEYLPTAESPLALAEASMLTQVVSNLLTNALNYTPAGGSVTVQTHRQRAAAQDWITLTVRDTGPGIAAHELPHVFERFYRGEVGRKAKAPGTGLGLAISKEIVEKLGGRITVESQPATEGRGTAFTVWLRPQP
jgi:PAS domain S-box-containing protein